MQLGAFATEVPGTGSLIKLTPLGDIHLGAPACDVQALRRVVAAIANDPLHFWIGMGDYGDCILPTDPRWTARAIDWSTVQRDSRGHWDVSDLAEWTVDLVEKELKPILTPQKCLGLLEGNHEQAMAKHYFTDLTKRLGKRYDVPFLGQTAMVRWSISRGNSLTTQALDIFAEHGATGGGTEGNSVNNFIKRLENWDADIYLKGHVHRRQLWRKTAYRWGNGRLRQRPRVMALTGTFLRAYQEDELTYSERAAYAPTEIGGTTILIRPFTKEPRMKGAPRTDYASLEGVYTDALAMLDREGVA